MVLRCGNDIYLNDIKIYPSWEYSLGLWKIVVKSILGKKLKSIIYSLMWGEDYYTLEVFDGLEQKGKGCEGCFFEILDNEEPSCCKNPLRYCYDYVLGIRRCDDDHRYKWILKEPQDVDKGSSVVV